MKIILLNFLYWFFNKLLSNSIWDTNLKTVDFRVEKSIRDEAHKNRKELYENLLSKVGLEIESDGFEEIEQGEYLTQLSLNRTKKPSKADLEKSKATYDAVVDYRKFEIEMYWKRSTYFWAFTASAFVAYAALLRTEYAVKLPMIIVISIGFTLSNAWYYSNIASKIWQRHWEKHLDLLENPHTGPLYKTIFSTKTYSVSKINDIVSNAFRLAWVALGLYFFAQTKRLYVSSDIAKLDVPIFLIVAGTVLIWISMKFGKGRGRFRARTIKIYRRL